jgi:hypothetical protein
MENQTEKQTADNKKVEKSRHFAVWSGVIFFFLLIFFLWVANIESLISAWLSGGQKEYDLEVITEEFNKKVEETANRMDDFKMINSSTVSNNP